MKTQSCDECQFHSYVGHHDFVCLKNHRPRFIMPSSPIDDDYGFKRKCGDFSQIPQSDT